MTFSNNEQYENALSPMKLTDDGIDISLSELHLWNALDPIEVNDEFFSNNIWFIEHDSKAEFPIWVTDDGIKIFFNEQQPLKAHDPIDFTVLEIDISESNEHPLNANESILVTDGGIIILRRSIHMLKA